MGKTPETDDFTFTPTVEPCTLAARAAEAGITDKLDHAVAQILEHRRTHGIRSSSGPTAAWLQGVLDGRGIHLDVQSIRRHINGGCSCHRTAQ